MPAPLGIEPRQEPFESDAPNRTGNADKDPTKDRARHPGDVRRFTVRRHGFRDDYRVFYNLYRIFDECIHL